GFVPDTIRAFEAAGLSLHNDAILVTALGTLALRAGRTFGGARRLARAHQYVLVFVKGDPRKAVEACGPVDIEDIETRSGVPLVVPDACPDAPTAPHHRARGVPHRPRRPRPWRDQGTGRCWAHDPRRRVGLRRPGDGLRATGARGWRCGDGSARRSVRR